MACPRVIACARAWVVAGLLLAGFGAAGCTLAPAKVWNLEQLHETDGPPRRRGNLHGDFEFLLTQAFRKTNFGGPEFQQRQAEEKRIKNPLAKCLENVLALSHARRDERVAGLQAATYAWLVVDCTYVLSRERCALELGGLARDLGVAAAPAPPEGEPTTPEAVKSCLDLLLTTLREIQAAPGLAAGSLAETCARLRALPLDRPGALRLLRATNQLLENGEGEPTFAPLRELRRALAQRCIVLALRAALTDPEGRVRAAALESALSAFPSERAELLRWAVTASMEGVLQREDVSLRGLELVARFGLPTPPAGVAEADFERTWCGILVQVLRLAYDDRHNTAACQALAKITGAPASLRPEVWMARRREAEALAPEPEPAPDSAAPTVPAPAPAPDGAGAKG